MSNFTGAASVVFEYANIRSAIRTQPRRRAGRGQAELQAGAQERPAQAGAPEGEVSAGDGGADGAELARGARADEGDGQDADDGDEGDEQGVLDEAGAALVGTEASTQVRQVDLPQGVGAGHVGGPCA